VCLPRADYCGLQTDTLPQTADALYAAVPDFGGYLLKIGSEKQGGKPTPALINAIAKTLQGPRRNGTIVLRAHNNFSA
jgi:hypothetical protein